VKDVGRSCGSVRDRCTRASAALLATLIAGCGRVEYAQRAFDAAAITDGAPRIDAPVDGASADDGAASADGADGDALVVDGGAGCGPFGPPVLEPSLLDTDANTPFVARDGSALYIALLTPTFPDVARLPWIEAAGAWGAPETVPDMSTSGTEYGPTLSADALLFFVGGTGFIRYASRADTAGSFSALAQVVELGDDGARSPEISSDGLSLYYGGNTRDAGDIWVASRGSRAELFSAPRLAAELSSDAVDDSPSLSADGLTIVISSDRPGGRGRQDLWIATRAATDAAFGAPVPIDGLASADDDDEPALSPDATTLYFHRPAPAGGDQIWRSSRICP
jgi:hypothetical protein